MNKTTWQLAKKIFDEALELSGADREAFIDRECAGNEELKSQVGNLLGAYDSGFMEETAFGFAAVLVSPVLKSGQQIGRYRIGEMIGTGGMGQVFRADDTELDRPVAFKVLHSDVAQDKERVRRFIQEARAASALNHPNILTIHEIGAYDDSRFIVSEFIDGETLRDRVRIGLTAAQSLDVAIQIATALDAAHSAGIVHRDIKPENVMIRSDGLVKILDFGIAKLTESDDFPIDAGAHAPSLVQTSPGLVMGTAAYMSPEQARGLAVDARSDLWSLGVVLFEMLTGKPPFAGDSVTGLVTSIMNVDAPANLEVLPPELMPICRRALAKDRVQRYQSARDLLDDLQGEKKRMENAIQRSVSENGPERDDLNTQFISSLPTPGTGRVVTGVRRRNYAVLSAVLFFIAGAVGLLAFSLTGGQQPNQEQGSSAIDASTTERDLSFSKIPVSGHTKEAAISPDGKYIAYLDLPPKGIKLLDQGTMVQTELVPAPASGNFSALGFSPDSKYVYYAATPGGNGYGIWRVPVSGGTPVIMVEHSYTGVSFSPDGSTIVFLKEVRDGLDGQIVVLANPDGSNERTIAKFDSKNWVENVPVWSPDGKTVACQVNFGNRNNRFIKLVGVSIDDGRQTPISDMEWTYISGAAWLPNGNLVISAKEKVPASTRASLLPFKLWLVQPGQTAKPITSGEVNYEGLSSTPKGDMLVTLRVTRENNLWRTPSNDPSKATQVISTGELEGGFNWTPDGRIIAGTGVTGDIHLWIMNSGGGDRTQITRGLGWNVQPTVSPDGKTVAFVSNRVEQKGHIFRMNIDGTDVRQLTNGAGEGWARFSADGKWIYYIQNREQKPATVDKIPVNGGGASTVVSPPEGWRITSFDISGPDGRIAYGLSRRPGDAYEFVYRIGILRENATAPDRLIDVPTGLRPPVLRWNPDGRSVDMLDGKEGFTEALDIWTLSIDGKGRTKPVTNYRTPAIFNFNWSFDGKQLLYNRSTISSEPVLIRNTGK